MNFNLNIPTKIFFGEGKISELESNITAYGNKIMLVYGKDSIKKNGIYQAVIDELTSNGFEYVELSGVDPNPRISLVRKGVDICKREGIEFILAVGGGSTIDCAKAIAAGAKYDGDPWDICSFKAWAYEALPIGVVLTVAASGSEMNNGSVITNDETNQKYGWESDAVYPKFSILDPTYTFSVSKHQTACGIVDTLTHIYEFYFNVGNNADITDRMSEAVMKTVIKYGKIAYNRPDNFEARSNLMWASSLALNGTLSAGKEFDGFNHLTEHAISGIYDITHADGLSILAPYWMEYILDDNTVEKFSEFARNVWDINNEDNYEAAKEAIRTTREFYKHIGMPTKLSEVGIDASRFEDIMNESIYGETLGCFKKLTREDIRIILTNAL